MDEFRPELIRKEEERLNSFSDTGTFWLLIVVALILLAVSVRIFGVNSTNSGPISGSLTPTPTATQRPARVYTVSYKSGVFSPTNLRIHAGDTVRFRNDHFLSMHVVSDQHPAHNGLPGFDSVGDIPAGGYFAFTFSQAGVFGYHNERNVNETGLIIVR